MVYLSVNGHTRRTHRPKEHRENGFSMRLVNDEIEWTGMVKARKDLRFGFFRSGRHNQSYSFFTGSLLAPDSPRRRGWSGRGLPSLHRKVRQPLSQSRA